jgi:hypothetical protein
VTCGNSAAKSWEIAILHELYLSTIGWVPVLFLFSNSWISSQICAWTLVGTCKSYWNEFKLGELQINVFFASKFRLAWIPLDLMISFISLCYCYISKWHWYLISVPSGFTVKDPWWDASASHQPHGKKSAAGAKHSTEIKLALVTGNLTCIPQLPRWKWPMGIGAPRSYVRLPKGSGRSGKCCFLQLLLAQAIWRLPVCLTQVWRVYHAARNGYTTHRGRLYTSHKWTWTAPHTTFDVDVGAIDPCVSIDLYTMFINVLLLFKSHNKLRPAQGQRSPPYGSVAQNQHSCHCECRALPSWQCRNSKRTSVACRRRSRSI